MAGDPGSVSNDLSVGTGGRGPVRGDPGPGGGSRDPASDGRVQSDSARLRQTWDSR